MTASLKDLHQIIPEFFVNEKLEDFVPQLEDVLKDVLKASSVKVIISPNDINNSIMAAGFSYDTELESGEKINIYQDNILNYIKKCNNNIEHYSFQIKVGEKLLGVINIVNNICHPYSENEIYYIKCISDICALKILESLDVSNKPRKVDKINLINSTMAHDINNFLGILSGYLDLIEKDFNIAAKLEDYIYLMHAEIKRIKGVMKDTMDYSNNCISITRKEFKSSELITDLKRYSEILLEGKDINMTFITKVISIYADQERLYRVLFNLISNSIDALGKKGNIYVKIKESKNNLYFIVFDNGKGISKVHHKNIFKPYFTTGKENGTGLGLVIVRDIVNAHKGKIRLRSVEGKYTCFVIRIPKYESI